MTPTTKLSDVAMKRRKDERAKAAALVTHRRLCVACDALGGASCPGAKKLEQAVDLAIKARVAKEKLK